ncbi:MAG TPA: deoxyribonuclease V [Gemmataceae bacterium]|jgi:deoxyribonuclease V
MRIRPLHTWDLTPKQAVALQRELASRVETGPSLGDVELVAGADISYNRFSPTIYAGVVVVRLKDGEVIERSGVVTKTAFPYVPGLLSFREAPAALEAFAGLKHKPEAVLLDGQGYAHPRRVGLASHIGLWLGRPCVGCAKSRLIGEFKPPKLAAGSWSDLIDKDEVIGRVVRTKTGVNPLFVSVGHKIDLDSAVRLTLAACRGYRLPEPTRQAHIFVNELRGAQI